MTTMTIDAQSGVKAFEGDVAGLLDELKLLARTHWVGFTSGEEVFQRLIQE